MSSMEALVLQPFASGGMLSVQSHMHTTQDIPLSSVLKPDSCLTVTVTVICALAYLISLYPHRQPLWKGPFLRRLAPLESLPVELQEAKLPLWKHLSLLTLSFLLAATQCAWSAWKALDASGVSYTLYPLPYVRTLLISHPQNIYTYLCLARICLGFTPCASCHSTLSHSSLLFLVLVDHPA